jgi:tRNA dimethylallyltransferase
MVRSPVIPLIIAGPTASGKSHLAVKLAQKYHGEIICADSRQFYKGMMIGTACPSKDDIHLVPHHGYQTVDPLSEKIDAGFFIKFAKNKIEEIKVRGKLPILVGGTGLYFRALHYGLNDVPPSQKTISLEIARRCTRFGLGKLYSDLQKIDPLSAKVIKAQDGYRIMRALEIFYITGIPPSVLKSSFSHGQAQIHAHWIYKKPDKKLLLTQIGVRVRNMFAHGLVDEAKLLRKYLPKDHWGLEVMGYKEALRFLDKELTLEEAIEKTLIRHRQYAKRQYTWFNKEPFYRFIIS